MSEFMYWYAYFDAIFTKKSPTANRALVSLIPTTTGKWPQECPLFELSQCFYELQKFILDQKNWSQSTCTIDELNQMEADVTNVLLLLEIEKLYIIEFWEVSKRRVQASFTHLYAILQLFVGSIIPYQNMTLFQCKAANKLCVKIVNLQDLFKSLMRKINSICAYFLDTFFDEEDLILRNFFENFVEFMKIIPKIKKTKMFHVSELLKYVIIVNSIEIASSNYQKSPRPNIYSNQLHDSKKSPKNIEKFRKFQSLDNLRVRIKTFNGWILRSSRKSSCPHKEPMSDENTKHYLKAKNILCFLFPNWIRRHSIKHRKQSLPKLNISIMENIKGKSSSQFRRPESPGEMRKTKERNKSATKTRLLLKSQSLVDNRILSPSKQGSIKQAGGTQKHSASKPAIEEDDESDVIEIMGSSALCKEFVKQKLNNNQCSLFSLSELDLIKQDRKQEARDEQLLLVELQKIVYS